MADLFDKDYRSWYVENSVNKIKIENGVMTLATTSNNAIGKAICRNCFFSGIYYFQADVALDQDISMYYGIMFGGIWFNISPKDKWVAIDEFSSSGWANIYSSASSRLRSYPQSNTLAVFVYNNDINCYLNGQFLIALNNENGFIGSPLSFVINGPGAGMIIDNVFAYQTTSIYGNERKGGSLCPNGAPTGYGMLTVENQTGSLQDIVVNGVPRQMYTGINYMFFEKGKPAYVSVGGNSLTYNTESCGENTLVLSPK